MGSSCSNSTRGVDDISIDGETNSARSRRRRRSRQADGVRSDSGSERALAEIRSYPHNANHFVDKDETGSPVVEPLTKKNTVMYTGSKQQITNYRSPGAPPLAPPSPPSTSPAKATSFISTETAATTRVPSSNTASAVVGNNAVKARLRGGVSYTNVGANPPEAESSITNPPHIGRIDSSGMLLQSIDSHSSTSSPLFRNDYGSTMSMDVKGFNRHASENTLAPDEQSFNDLPSRSDSATDAWHSNNNNTTTNSSNIGGRRQSSSDHTL